MSEKSAREQYKHAFIAADVRVDEVKPVISFSQNLDIILSGGIPLGSFVVVTGQKKLGKTTSLLHFAAHAQKEGCKIYYFDVEGRLKSRDLKGIPGLSTKAEDFEIICSTKKKILAAEDYLTILMDLLETEENCVFIVDSVSQLCSSGKAEANIGDRFRDDVPIMLATMTKRAANILPVNNHILVCVTHLIANQGGQGPAVWLEASGQKIQYQADVKLKATHIEKVEVDGKQIGQLIHWVCETSAIGPPGGKTTTLLRYGEGLDDYYDLLMTAIETGLVATKGAWVIFDENNKAQGKEKARNLLKENTQLYSNLQKQLAEILL